jgi:hypothetical protein
VPGLFYSTKLQSIIAWWKIPQNFAYNKVFRWVEHGVKVVFKKGLVFAPKPSAPKFVDPEDVHFVIQDLLKGRHIGVYQDLVPGVEQFLSRSRVHTPPVKGNQRIVHALCILNETTIKRQTTYEDLRILSPHASLPLGWTSSHRIWTIVMSVVPTTLHRHGMSNAQE